MTSTTHSLKKIIFILMSCFVCNCEKKAPPTPELNSEQEPTPAEPFPIPTTRGLLWMPMSWTFALVASPPLNSPANRIALKKVRLVLKANNSGSLHSLNLMEPQKNNAHVNSFVLDAQKNQVTFVSPPITELNSGVYSVLGIEALLQNTVGTYVPIQIPFPNPHPTSSSKDWNLTVHKGHIALGGRFVLRTVFKNEGGQGHTQTDIQALDTQALPIHLALEYLNQKNASHLVALSGNPHVFKIRVPLTGKNGETLPFGGDTKIGFLIKSPCHGTQTFVTQWKRQGDERDYIAVTPLKESCDSTQTQITAQVLSPQDGQWTLKGATLVSKSFVPPDTWWSTQDAPYLNRFFQFQDPRSLPIDHLKERDLSNPIFLNVLEKSSPKTNNEKRKKIGFLGTFEVKKGEDGQWDIVQLPAYTLAEVKNEFKNEIIFNAYTQEPLIADRPKGAIQTTVRLSVSNKNQDINNTFANDLRRLATETFANCLKKQEKIDPLATGQSHIQFQFLKGSSSITVKNIKSGLDTSSSQDISQCVGKKLFVIKLPKAAQRSGIGEFIIQTG